MIDIPSSFSPTERIFGLVSAGDGGGVGSMVNGGVGGGSGRQGVHFKEMLALLVLITKGTEEEKHKCEFCVSNCSCRSPNQMAK